MVRLAIVVMISNSDAHVVAPYVMGDLIINTRRIVTNVVQGMSQFKELHAR